MTMLSAKTRFQPAVLAASLGLLFGTSLAWGQADDHTETVRMWYGALNHPTGPTGKDLDTDVATNPLVAELSEGEDEVRYSFAFQDLLLPKAFSHLIVQTGTAPVEVNITVVTGDRADVFVNGFKTSKSAVIPGSDNDATWYGYRDLMLQPGESDYDLLMVNQAALAAHEHAATSDRTPWNARLLVRLHKVTWCSMWAAINGDIKLTTFGDVAYFNTFEEGVAGATGSMADSAAGEALQGILNTSNQLGDPDTMKKALALVRAAQGDKVDEAKQKKLEKEAMAAAEKAKAQRGGAAIEKNPISDELMRNMQGIGQGKEKFGLTLVNHKFLSDDAPKEVDDANNMETLLGAFTLEAASEGTYIPAPTFVEFPLSRMSVTPGARADYGNGDKVSFSWAPGQPGFAKLQIGNVTKNFITGVVAAELYTAGIYDGRRLKINVVAKFTAMRGAFSCQTAGTL